MKKYNKEYYESQKDCADMLGISLSKYLKSLKHIKYPKFDRTPTYNKEILEKLGLTKSEFLKRKFD